MGFLPGMNVALGTTVLPDTVGLPAVGSGVRQANRLRWSKDDVADLGREVEDDWLLKDDEAEGRWRIST